MKSPDILEKTRKNVIVHHYEYHYLQKDMIEEIERKEQELMELKRKLNARISVWLPSSHPIFQTKLLKRNKIVEWSSHTIHEGKPVQMRELVYVEKVNDQADITKGLDQSVMAAIDFSNEYYTHLECTHYGKETILKLSGFDVKDISKK